MTSTDVLTVPRTADHALKQRLRDVGSICTFQRGDVLSRADDAGGVHILFSGFVVAVKRLPDGLLQNVAIYLPGDIVGHEAFTLGSTRCDAIAFTPVTAHKVTLASLREAIESDREQAAAFWRHVAFHGALAQEWLLNLGRRPAYARTAHLLLEIVHRMGLENDSATACPMPLTQTELADTLGLSVVHVNRVLMRLKEEGLIRMRRGHMQIVDLPRFKVAAIFDPAYLDPRV